MVFLNYQVSDKEIAKHYLLLSIGISLSFLFFTLFFMWMDKFSFGPLIMSFLPFAFLAPIGWWYYRRGGKHHIYVSDCNVKCHSGEIDFTISLESIQRIEVKSFSGGEDRYDIFFIRTSENILLPLPSIHKLRPIEIIKALLQANPNIDTADIKKNL